MHQRVQRGCAVQVVDWGPNTVEVDVDAPQVLSQGKQGTNSMGV